jgi:hypothetical protein
MNSLKRLSPYSGPDIPEWVRKDCKEEFHYNSESSQWEWDSGSGTYQCQPLLCDLDSRLLDPTGYVVIVPLKDGAFCIRDTLVGEFPADAEVVSSKIFNSIPQVKAFLDSVLAFKTPEIPPASLWTV